MNSLPKVRFMYFLRLLSNIGVGSLVNSLKIVFEFLEIENYGIWTYHFFSEDFSCEFLCSHWMVVFFEDSNENIFYASSLETSFLESVKSESLIDKKVVIFY